MSKAKYKGNNKTKGSRGLTSVNKTLMLYQLVFGEKHITTILANVTVR